MTTNKTTIAVAKGDGIGPEIMDAVLRIFEAAQVPADYRFIEMGKSVFEAGHSTGMTDEAKNTIEELGILFKGPMETPKGKGVKSINVTARKVWNTYANVRKFRSFQGVDTIFSRAGIPINMTVLRENIEDTYGGIEFMHTPDVAVSYRLISRPGSEQFIRYCFEYARQQGVKTVTCGHKANIMKMTDGMFMSTFYEVAKEYPDIQVNDLIVDDLAMKLVRSPQMFEVLVLTNLQGDILSDLCAGLVGGLGFAPSANIGDNISIFEAVHGTAPDIAGKKIANPTSLLMSGILMLRHIGCITQADTIENALLYTLEQGQHTADFGAKNSTPLNTDEYADAIISHLGKKPVNKPIEAGLGDNCVFKKPVRPEELRMLKSKFTPKGEEKLSGADIFVSCEKRPDEIAEIVQKALPESLKLVIISNRGTQVWPEASIFTDSIAHYNLRLELKDDSATTTEREILESCLKLMDAMKVVNIEFLKSWGDLKGYSLAQGQ
ncbi:MAG: NADP-dependent isocitrate dehydrogenase [Bacteroidia bacterium]